MIATALASLPSAPTLPLIVIVGALRYPVPWLVTVIELSLPFLPKDATAVAPVPLHSIITSGALV
jgi:hypothetical protein